MRGPWWSCCLAIHCTTGGIQRTTKEVCIPLFSPWRNPVQVRSDVTVLVRQCIGVPAWTLLALVAVQGQLEIGSSSLLSVLGDMTTTPENRQGIP